jgi:hypothetical protein
MIRLIKIYQIESTKNWFELFPANKGLLNLTVLKKLCWITRFIAVLGFIFISPESLFEPAHNMGCCASCHS